MKLSSNKSVKSTSSIQPRYNPRSEISEESEEDSEPIEINPKMLDLTGNSQKSKKMRKTQPIEEKKMVNDLWEQGSKKHS